MLVGLLAAVVMIGTHRIHHVIEVRPEGPRRPGLWTRLVAALRRLAPERVLLRGSIAVLFGFALACDLGFGFQTPASLRGWNALTNASSSSFPAYSSSLTTCNSPATFAMAGSQAATAATSSKSSRSRFEPANVPRRLHRVLRC